MSRPPAVTGSRPRSRLATAAIATASVAALTAFLPLAFWATLPLAVTALVLAGLARRRARQPGAPGRDTATAALVVGGFALVVASLSGLATWNATRLPADYDPTYPVTEDGDR